MKKTTTAVSIVFVMLFGSMTSCNKTNNTNVSNVNAIVKSSAGDSAAVVTKINEFRLLSGDPLNTAPGSTTGRREINWDAVPPAFTNLNNFPFDFFGGSDAALPNGRKRGLILQNTGNSFRTDSTAFADIDTSYATQFRAFSKERLFSSLDNNVTEVKFKIPGTESAATVHGFGVIFSDVDNANSSTIEYFSNDKSLGIFKVPVKTEDGNFSFLGVNFPDEKITKVRITSGNGILGTGIKDISDGGTKDLVVMDDFIYDEPKTN